MAHEEPRRRWKGEEPLRHRVVERARVALGEVAAADSDVVEEERVTGEDRVAHLEAHAGGRVARRRDRLELQPAEIEHLPIGEEDVELSAVGAKLVEREDVLEDALDLGDARADRHLRAVPLLEPLASREVIGVSVGLEDVAHVELLPIDEGRELLERLRPHLPSGWFEVEDRIDHDRAARGLVEHDIGDGKRPFIEEGLDVHGHSGSPCAGVETESLEPLGAIHPAGLTAFTTIEIAIAMAISAKPIRSGRSGIFPAKGAPATAPTIAPAPIGTARVHDT